MPWRRYESSAKDGRFGKIYTVSRGVKVRMDHRGKWTVFIEKDGRRKNRTIGEGREGLCKAVKVAEAVAERKATGLFRKKLAKQPVAEKKALTFVEYAGRWYRAGLKKWKDETEVRYEEILRLYIHPFDCFHKPLEEIGRRDIKEHLREIYAGRSPATVETVHAVISGVFNEAIDDELVTGNPATGILKRILPPKNRRNLKPADPLSAEELNRFIGAAERISDRTEQMVLKAMAYAGLRLGEALAMRVANLDVASGTYLVAESYKTRKFQLPKADKQRLVDLPAFWCEELKGYLAELRKESLRDGYRGRIDLLFVDPEEKGGPWPYSQRKIQGLVKRVCRAAGLRQRNPHDLRHTYATILLMNNVSPAYVQKQLGHHSIAMTVDNYGHWIPGEGRCDLDSALGGVPKPREGSVVRKPHIFAYPPQKAKAVQAST